MKTAMLDKTKKKKKIVKGISLSQDVINYVDKEREKQHRSFSSQMEFIISEWAKRKRT